MVGFFSVDRQHVVEVEGERRVREPITAVIPGWELRISPSGVRRDLVEEQVDLACAAAVDEVRRQQGHRDVADHGGQAVIDEPVIEQVFQDGRNRGDGESAAHVQFDRRFRWSR